MADFSSRVGFMREFTGKLAKVDSFSYALYLVTGRIVMCKLLDFGWLREAAMSNAGSGRTVRVQLMGRDIVTIDIVEAWE